MKRGRRGFPTDTPSFPAKDGFAVKRCVRAKVSFRQNAQAINYRQKRPRRQFSPPQVPRTAPTGTGSPLITNYTCAFLRDSLRSPSDEFQTSTPIDSQTIGENHTSINSYAETNKTDCVFFRSEFGSNATPAASTSANQWQL